MTAHRRITATALVVVVRFSLSLATMPGAETDTRPCAEDEIVRGDVCAHVDWAEPNT